MSLMRITPEAGSIEVGHICFAPSLQRTRAASETIFLLANWVFREGYRRFEWKCDALNRPSRRAAERFGFSCEGVFRQATIVKGRNRDTAWFAMIDGDWPCLRPAWEAWLDPANFDADGRQRRPLGASDRALPRRLGPRGVSRKGADPPLAAALEGRLGRRRSRRARAAGATRRSTCWSSTTASSARSGRTSTASPRASCARTSPTPRAIRRLAGQGVKAILNLRGATEYGSYLLEREACAAAGIELVDFKLSSRVLPTRDGDPRARRALRAAAAALPHALQVGGGPGGLRGGALPAAARRGHGGGGAGAAVVALPAPEERVDRASCTSCIDRYAADAETEPMSFREWVETRYDPAALTAAYRSDAVSDFIVDRVLGRE